MPDPQAQHQRVQQFALVRRIAAAR